MNEIQSLFPSWFQDKAFILTNGQWVGLLILAIFGIVTERTARYFIFAKIKSIFKKRNIELKTKRGRDPFTAPAGVVIFSGIWCFGIKFLELPVSYYDLFYKGGELALIAGSIFTVAQLVDISSIYLIRKALESENKLDDILVPLVAKTLKFFIYAFGIALIGNSLNLDMKGLLAGLGIGGFAFAFAAKDAIGNLFGSLTVLLDRPFAIGDWVVIDSKIEGTVEEVGLRSTRIRTFYDSVISVPNGKLTNVEIDNYGKRKYRRYSTKLGLTYDTPLEKINEFCQGVREIILAHEYTRKDYFHVYFNNMADSSLEVMLYVFWEVPDWSKELEEKHKLLVDIMKCAKEVGVSFAFPTQTLHLHNEN